MANPDGASVEQVTGQLAERLVAIRREQAEASEEERRQTFRQALSEGLQGLDDEAVAELVRGNAYHQAGHVYIDIIDDGGGIDCPWVGQKAARILTPKENPITK